MDTNDLGFLLFRYVGAADQASTEAEYAQSMRTHYAILTSQTIVGEIVPLGDVLTEAKIAEGTAERLQKYAEGLRSDLVRRLGEPVLEVACRLHRDGCSGTTTEDEALASATRAVAMAKELNQ